MFCIIEISFCVIVELANLDGAKQVMRELATAGRVRDAHEMMLARRRDRWQT